MHDYGYIASYVYNCYIIVMRIISAWMHVSHTIIMNVKQMPCVSVYKIPGQSE